MPEHSVLFIAPLPPPVTGQSLAAQLLADSLRAECQLCVIDPAKRSFEQAFNFLGRVAEVARQLRRVARARAPGQIVYFNVSQSVSGNVRDLLIFWLLRRCLGRVVIHLHGGAGMRRLLSARHPVLRALNAWFLKRLGGAVVLGQSLRSIYGGLVPQDRIHVVPNFAPAECFVSEAEISQKFACLAPLRLLFLSNLLPGKGHEELLEALMRLPAGFAGKLEIDFAGGFESEAARRAFVLAATRVSGVPVRVHGVVQGALKADLLRRAHLLCLPTYYPYEGQPISILEAYASGCAVLTTLHGGISDVFVPGVNGIVVGPRSVDEVLGGLIKALENPLGLKQFALNNWAEACAKYRPEDHLRALKKVIFSVGPT